MYRKVDGLLLNPEEVGYHLFNIISGIYSLGGQPDKALIEYRVQFDPIFEAISYQGVPDIRVIVFLGVPVMSMVRLPTRMSGGKANLHQGAIGAGIDIAEREWRYIDQLVDRLVWLVSDRELRTTMGRRAAERARHLTVEAQTERIVAILEGSINSGAVSRKDAA